MSDYPPPPFNGVQLRAPDFVDDDVFFADSARSMIEHGFYGINCYRETD
jgi:hypothetical protein